MNQDLRCSQLYKVRLENFNAEAAKIRRLRIGGCIIGIPLIFFGLTCCFVKIIEGEELGNLFKIMPVLSGGFFSTIGLFNKGDSLDLKQKISALKIHLEYYARYEMLSDDDKGTINEECKKIIEKTL